MGVRMSSSCLMMSRKPDAGLLGSSEGRVAERGVLRDGILRVGKLKDVWRLGVGRLEDVLRLGVGMVGKDGDGRLGIWTVGVLRAGNAGFGDVEGMIAGLLNVIFVKETVNK